MTRIKDAATTATSAATDDYLLIDGATNGSRKILASNVGGTALRLITETVTSGSATNVSFTSIAATYRDLEVRVRGRGTKSATNCDVRMRFNSDTGSNYDLASAMFQASSALGQNVATTYITIGHLAAASAPTNAADAIAVQIIDYRGTTFQKAVMGQGTIKQANSSGSLWTEIYSGWWRNTAAITQIDIFPDSNAFVDGTVVSLYGRM